LELALRLREGLFTADRRDKENFKAVSVDFVGVSLLIGSAVECNSPDVILFWWTMLKLIEDSATDDVLPSELP
jgi:hypothetical protein